MTTLEEAYAEGRKDEREEWETREAMSARDYLQSAIDVPLAYLHATFHFDDSADPLDVEFYWDEPGFGSILKMNLREEWLEIFNDDPEKHADRMTKVSASLRSLAEEIDAIRSGQANTK